MALFDTEDNVDTDQLLCERYKWGHWRQTWHGISAWWNSSELSIQETVKSRTSLHNASVLSSFCIPIFSSYSICPRAPKAMCELKDTFRQTRDEPKPHHHSSRSLSRLSWVDHKKCHACQVSIRRGFTYEVSWQMQACHRGDNTNLRPRRHQTQLIFGPSILT